jgi:hypothetical protein
MKELILRHTKVIDFIDKGDEQLDVILRDKERPVVTISDDFESFGFVNVIVAAPMGRVWTFFPTVDATDSLLNGLTSVIACSYIDKALLYFKKNKIKKSKMRGGLLDVIGIENAVDVPYGLYWVIAIPAKLVDKFAAWLQKVITVLIDLSCNMDEGVNQQDFELAWFEKEGDWFPSWKMFRKKEDQQYFFDSHGDLKYPVTRLEDSFKAAYNALCVVEKVFDSLGANLFMARNGFRQKNVAFPYCDDEFEEYNEYPLRVIEKRVELINKFNLPHFYESICRNKYSLKLNAREQLCFLINHNRGKYLLSRLEAALSSLDAGLRRVESEYKNVLFFER